MSISLDQQSEILYSFFLFYVQIEVYQNMLKLKCWLLAFTLYRAFYKTKRGLNLVSLDHFLRDFWKEFQSFKVSHVISRITLYSFSHSQISLIDWGFTSCDIVNFKTFVIKSFCFMVKKSGQKLKYLENTVSF